MTKVVAHKEFTHDQMEKQRRIIKDKKRTAKEREKAKRFLAEMLTYNARAMRGDFDQ